LPAALGSAINGPVMHDGKLPVGRRMYVEFDNISPSCEGGLHRGQGVFKQTMSRLVDELCCAGIVIEIVACKCLMHAAMRDEAELRISGRGNAPAAIEEPDTRDHCRAAEKYPISLFQI